jgi:hypothetical protein
VAASQNGKILRNDRIEKRRHELVFRKAGLQMPDHIRLGKNTTFRCDMDEVVFVWQVTLFAQLLRSHANLACNFFNRCSGSGSAFVIHGRDCGECASVGVLPENDDFRILASKFDNGSGIRKQPPRRKRNRIDFLNKPRPEQGRDRSGA